MLEKRSADIPHAERSNTGIRLTDNHLTDNQVTNNPVMGDSALRSSHTHEGRENGNRPVVSIANSSESRRDLLRKIGLLSIEVDRMDEAADLEQRCYAHPWSRALVRGEFQKDISARFGATLDNHLVAYCFTYIIPDEMHILNLAVAPERRGNGIGRFLLCHSLASGIQRGVRSVSLEVRPSNKSAIALYSSLGFRRIAVRLNYYRDNGEDALILEKKLLREDMELIKEHLQT